MIMDIRASNEDWNQRIVAPTVNVVDRGRRGGQSRRHRKGERQKLLNGELQNHLGFNSGWAVFHEGREG